MSQPTMTAAVAPTYGPPSVFELQQLPIPAIAADQLLVRVRATCVNPADAKQRSGNLKLVMKHAFPLVLGQDFAGVVEQVGGRCTRFKVGDEVMANRRGDWCRGTIVARPYREPEFGPEFLAPYQIELHDRDRTLIYTPVDDDECIKEAIDYEAQIKKLKTGN